MTVTQLLCPSTSVSPPTSTLAPSERSSLEEEKAPAGDVVPSLSSYKQAAKSNALVSPISLTLLRLIELTTRTSDVLKSQEASALIHSDPVTSVFRTFAWLLGGAAQRLRVKIGVDVASWEDFDAVISRRVTEENAGMVVIPWSRGNSTTGPSSTPDETAASTLVKNPFDGVFQRSNSSTPSYDQTTTAVVYSELIRKVFLTAPCDVALFVDRGLDSGASDVASMMSGTTGPDTLLVLPFFGGPDDRLALKFLVKMCAGNEGVKAIVIKINKTEENEEIVDDAECSKGHVVVHNTIAAADTVYGQHNTQTRLASDTADNILWERYTSSSTTRTPVLTSALSRITFKSVSTSKPLQAAVDSMIGSDIKSISSGRRTVAVIGRSRRMAVESLDKELQHMSKNAGVAMGSSVAKTLGNVGAAMVLAGVDASLLIVQAHYSA